MLTPPFRHRADVERDEADRRGAWNAPDPPDFQPHLTGTPLDYWVTSETLLTGPNVNATVEIGHALIPRTADIRVGDEIDEIRNERAEVISQARLRVAGDIVQEPSHRELRLEVVGHTKPAEGS